MKHLLLSLTLILSLTACQDKKNDAKAQAAHDAKIAAQAKAELLAEIEAKKKASLALKQKSEQEKNDKLDKIGIAVEQGTITIDTNKTKDFLQQLSQRMEMQMQKISNDLQKGIIDAKEEGIQINDEHINIDLNKTRNLLDDWSKKIQIFVNQFNTVSNTIESNTSKGH